MSLRTGTPNSTLWVPSLFAWMAERIIQWRDTNGRFTSVEDLLAVPGIGDKMLETLRDLVTV